MVTQAGPSAPPSRAEAEQGERDAATLARLLASGQLAPQQLPPDRVYEVQGDRLRVVWVRAPERSGAWAVLYDEQGAPRRALSIQQYTRRRRAERRGPGLLRSGLPPVPDVQERVRDGRAELYDPLRYPPRWRDVGSAEEWERRKAKMLAPITRAFGIGR